MLFDLLVACLVCSACCIFFFFFGYCFGTPAQRGGGGGAVTNISYDSFYMFSEVKKITKRINAVSSHMVTPLS